MAPIAFGLSAADSSFRSPMATAVIGGLITSTVLSLLVVPAVFIYVDDVEGWIRGTARRIRAKVVSHGHEARDRLAASSVDKGAS
jgi:hypothetical protein